MSRRDAPGDEPEPVDRDIRLPFRPSKRAMLRAEADAKTEETRRALLSAELIKDDATRELFIDTLLAAGRLDEALAEWDRAGVDRSSTELIHHAGDLLRKGEFVLAVDYYSAADAEIPREMYLRHWVRFLTKCQSPDAIIRFCKQLGIEYPKSRLMSLADGIVAKAETGDLLALGHAVRAYAAAGATHRLVHLADDCRKLLAMTRDQTRYVIDIYRTAGASARIMSLARALGPWANVDDFIACFTASGESPSDADFVAFGTANRERGNFEVAIAAYRRAGATKLLRTLAIRIVQAEARNLGQFDLSPAGRSLALEALHAASETDKHHELRAA